jgi:hypothetical protein
MPTTMVTGSGVVRPTAPEAPRTEPAAAPRQTPAWWLRVLPYAAFLIVSLIVVGPHMHDIPYVSPTDESVHFDYVERMPHVPAAGERLDQPALRAWACRGFPPGLDFDFPACRSRSFDAENFPGGGFSYAGATPPLYYAVTAVVSRPVAAITGRSLFGTVRWCGALWLAGLMSVAFLIGRRLGASRLSATAGAVLTGTVLDVVTSAATIGPDIASALVSGLVLLAVLSFDGGRRTLLLLLGASALAALTKLTTFTAIGAALVFVLLLPLMGRRPGFPWSGRTISWPRALLTCVAVVVVFGGLSQAWGASYNSRAVMDPALLPINQMFAVDKLDYGLIWEATLYPFLTTGGDFRPFDMLDGTNGFVEPVAGGLQVLCLLVLATSWRRFPRPSALGIGALLAAIIGPWVLLELNFHVNGLAFTIVPRYGFGMLPVVAAAMAWVCRGPGPSRALAVIAVLSVVNVIT